MPLVYSTKVGLRASLLTNHGSLRVSPVYRIALPCPSITAKYQQIIPSFSRRAQGHTEHNRSRAMICIEQGYLYGISRPELQVRGCLQRQWFLLAQVRQGTSAGMPGKTHENLAEMIVCLLPCFQYTLGIVDTTGVSL